jgi:hypothetical protein
VLTLAQLYLLRTNASIRSKSGGGKLKFTSDSTISNVSVAGTSPTRLPNMIRVGGTSTRTVKATNFTGQHASTRNHDNHQTMANESSDITAPLLTNAHPRGTSFTSSMQSQLQSEGEGPAFPRTSTFNGADDHYGYLEEGDSRVFDQSALSAMYMSPQAHLLTDTSMTPSDFLSHVRLSHYPTLISPVPATANCVPSNKKSPSPAATQPNHAQLSDSFSADGAVSKLGSFSSERDM